METLGKWSLTILILIASSFIAGFTFQTLWGWFIVTIFNLKSLTLLESIGIMVFLSYFRHKKRDQDLDVEDILDNFGYFILNAAVALGMGGIIYIFMQ